MDNHLLCTENDFFPHVYSKITVYMFIVCGSGINSLSVLKYTCMFVVASCVVSALNHTKGFLLGNG